MNLCGKNGSWRWMMNLNAIIKHSLDKPPRKRKITPRKLNGWNLSLHPFRKGNPSSQSHHFQVPAVNLGGCKLNKNLGPFLAGRSMPKMIPPKNNIKEGPFPLLQHLYLATWVNRNINLKKTYTQVPNLDQHGPIFYYGYNFQKHL